MATKVARKSDPALWEKVKAEVTAGDKGGRPGRWSARKAQLASHLYQERGGGYVGRKSGGNSLRRWTEEGWGTKSGRKSGETGERYLPERARAALSDSEYRRTSEKKRADTARGRQFSRQPEDVAAKTSRARRGSDGGPTRATLYAEAKRRGLRGRSRMSKAELERGLAARGVD